MHEYGDFPGAGDAEESEPVGGDEPRTTFPRSGAVGDMLFAYGTLQFAPVLEALLGRVPRSRLGVARGRRVAALPGRAYPGLVPAAGRIAAGLLLEGLTRAEWEILDRFEDAEYDLRPIRLVLPPDGDEPGGTDVVPAYVWTAATTGADWRPEAFARANLADYAQRCEHWRASGMPSDGW
ncbi:gamma-glutamylcyclotransferase family protein [Nocardia sp. BMG111209]|uniref:gamma-glutamylcyclotransferase family protein n=1 Tax=Nocardia sp. BMG111209 TaxID=1160137 RepID=UPI0003676553|nr:gamma-glutamylcyclotransferase family protein [Nocardia sp. BMG111209]